MIYFANGGFNWHDLYFMPTKLREFYWRELLKTKEEEREQIVKKTIDDRFKLQSTLIVRKKTNKKTCNSTGVEDIQKLPLDWFQSVKQNNKQHKIIPRQKEQV